MKNLLLSTATILSLAPVPALAQSQPRTRIIRDFEQLPSCIPSGKVECVGDIPVERNHFYPAPAYSTEDDCGHPIYWDSDGSVLYIDRSITVQSIFITDSFTKQELEQLTPCTSSSVLVCVPIGNKSMPFDRKWFNPAYSTDKELGGKDFWASDGSYLGDTFRNEDGGFTFERPRPTPVASSEGSNDGALPTAQAANPVTQPAAPPSAAPATPRWIQTTHLWQETDLGTPQFFAWANAGRPQIGTWEHQTDGYAHVYANLTMGLVATCNYTHLFGAMGTGYSCTLQLPPSGQ